jgi:hypothetical protein
MIPRPPRGTLQPARKPLLFWRTARRFTVPHGLVPKTRGSFRLQYSDPRSGDQGSLRPSPAGLWPSGNELQGTPNQEQPACQSSPAPPALESRHGRTRQAQVTQIAHPAERGAARSPPHCWECVVACGAAHRAETWTIQVKGSGRGGIGFRRGRVGSLKPRALRSAADQEVADVVLAHDVVAAFGA